MELENWLSFCSVALIATATPGPAVLLVSVHSMSYGFKKSLITVLGNITGLFLMSSVSIAGLAALVIYSAFAFNVLKIMGAGYLVYLGLKLWKNGIQLSVQSQRDKMPVSRLSLYSQGLLVALTNPKAIVFTSALFPQFVFVSEPLLPQFSLLVVSFMCLSVVCLSSYSFAAGQTRIKLRSRWSGNFLGKVFGGTFISAGCYLALGSGDK